MVLLYSECHFTCIFNHMTLQIAVISLYLCQIHVDMKRSLPKCNSTHYSIQLVYLYIPYNRLPAGFQALEVIISSGALFLGQEERCEELNHNDIIQRKVGSYLAMTSRSIDVNGINLDMATALKQFLPVHSCTF